MQHLTPSLQDWTTFYAIVGSAAAALIGLMFIVITLIGSSQQARSPEGSAAFSTPTVVHFGSALLLATVLVAPWPMLVVPQIIIALAGAYGGYYVASTALRIRRVAGYTADLEDWVWHTLLPMLAYVAIFAGAVALGTFTTQASFAFATAAVTMLFVGIHNAWDVVTYVAIIQPENDSKPDATPSE